MSPRGITPGAHGRGPNTHGAPWGGWPDPTEPRPTDDPTTRRNRYTLGQWLKARRAAGIPPEGLLGLDDDEAEQAPTAGHLVPLAEYAGPTRTTTNRK